MQVNLLQSFGSYLLLYIFLPCQSFVLLSFFFAFHTLIWFLLLFSFPFDLLLISSTHFSHQVFSLNQRSQKIARLGVYYSDNMFEQNVKSLFTSEWFGC